MKKLIALIYLTALTLALFASCGKAPDFIPMEKGSIVSVNWAQGGSRKDINNADVFDALADAYNSATETSSFKDDGHEWSVAVVCGDEKAGISMYHISYLGDDRFDVSISGKASTAEGNTRYSVVNPELSKLAESEFFTYESVSAKVSVKFVISAGVPDEDGTVRAEDEILNASEQTLTGNEVDLPTVSQAIVQALALEDFADGYEISKDSNFRIISLGGYEEKMENKADTADLFRWEISLNGEAVDGENAASTAVSDGDEVTVRYILKHPGE